MDPSTTAPIPSDLARREFPDLIPIHNSQLCDCAECRSDRAAIEAWRDRRRLTGDLLLDLLTGAAR